MSANENLNTSELLVNATVKLVGKREFLKTVEKLYGIKKSVVENKPRNKTDVPAAEQCVARCKGDRTGVKAGRYVLFDNVRCPRKEVNAEEHLCSIHCNQVTKFGSLPLGKYTEPVTDELKKVFGEL
jgi:hypothetical protein